MECRLTITKKLNSLAHLRKKATVKWVKEHYIWTNMAKDIAAVVEVCLSCKACKIQRHTKTPWER